MKLCIVLFAILQIINAQNLNSTHTSKKLSKRSYVCPPNFIRQGYRCYYFSKDPLSWQEAYFSCTNMRSNLAIIKNPYQDKLIRSFLGSKGLDPVDRWLGGVYDWEKQTWKWAASGKPLSYTGFGNSQKEENFSWQCIAMDPSLQYRWSPRSCVEKLHYICLTKMRAVNNKDKRKLKRQYNTNKFNKLNEIPVPTLPEYNSSDATPLKSNVPFSYNYKFEINQSLNDQALFGQVAPPQTKKRAKKAKKSTKKRNSRRRLGIFANGTVPEIPRKFKKNVKKDLHKTKGEPTSIRNIRWRTYKKEGKREHPFYPKPIVEEYNFVPSR